MAKHQQAEHIWFAIIHNIRTPVDLLAWLATPANTNGKLPLSYVKALANKAHQSLDLEQAVFSWNEIAVDERLIWNKAISSKLVDDLYSRDVKRSPQDRSNIGLFAHPNCSHQTRLKLVSVCQKYLVNTHEHEKDYNKLLKVAAEWAIKARMTEVDQKLLIMIMQRLPKELPDNFVASCLTYHEYLVRRAARFCAKRKKIPYVNPVSMTDRLKDYMYEKFDLFGY